jgi:hypothetical protein
MTDSGWRKRQIALDKKAENARELGLDYEPVFTYDQVKAHIQAAMLSEREACAKMFDEVMPLVPFAQNDQGGCLTCGFTPKLAAKAIRARGKQT